VGPVLCATRRGIEQKTTSSKRKMETISSKENVIIVERLDIRNLTDGIRLRTEIKDHPGTSLKVKWKLQWLTRLRMMANCWCNF